MKPKVMIVDDDAGMRDLVRTILEKSGYAMMEAANAAELTASLDGAQPDVVLLDLLLPDGNGIDLLPQLKKHWPETQVIVLTGNATYDAAVDATKRGAYHFQSKPFDHGALLLSVEKALEHKHLNEEASLLRKALLEMSGGTKPVFQSHAMKEVLRTVERVAPSEASILLVGESGTGKEIVADLIHLLSPRKKGPLIKINCAALPRELIESELFGSIRGSYTGSTADRDGLFRQAEGGTLLLDEIAEMPVDTQSKLLRVLQEKEVRPVGGRTPYKTDCRIIAATNCQVEEAIKSGKLRSDLYYRVGAICISLAPLRERREDILPLARSFLRQFDAQAGRSISGFSAAAVETLRSFDWPGNVRQLQNEIQRAVLMCSTDSIDVGDLSIAGASSKEKDGSLTLMDAMERNTIAQVLTEAGGNKLEAARRLGISRQTLYKKIRTYGLDGS